MIPEKVERTKQTECDSYGKMPSFEKRGLACATCPSVTFANCALETMKDIFGKRGIPMEKVETKKP
jgi:hypothetical protein